MKIPHLLENVLGHDNQRVNVKYSIKDYYYILIIDQIPAHRLQPYIPVQLMTRREIVVGLIASRRINYNSGFSLPVSLIRSSTSQFYIIILMNK